jgi:hypothetical protein
MKDSTTLWLKRFGSACLCGLAIWGFTAWVGLRPEAAMVIVVTVAVFAVVWLVRGVAAETAPVDWKPLHRPAGSSFGLDPRFSRLARSFSDGNDPKSVAEQVHYTLVRAIDERLAAKYGIDRQADPEAARRVLGELLTSYVELPPHVRRGNVPYLSKVVTRIESL